MYSAPGLTDICIVNDDQLSFIQKTRSLEKPTLFISETNPIPVKKHDDLLISLKSIRMKSLQ